MKNVLVFGSQGTDAVELVPVLTTVSDSRSDIEMGGLTSGASTSSPYAPPVTVSVLINLSKSYNNRSSRSQHCLTPSQY